MASRSFIRYLTLSIILPLVTAVPQAPLEVAQSETFVSGAAPANVAPTGAAQGCGTCLLVADVAGLVWYSQVFLNAQTEVVGVAFNNASRTTRTSLLQPEGMITYAPGGGGPQGALTQINYEPSLTISGATLTSPTAYNVFTGYTITSAYLNDGTCTTTTVVSTLQSAYSQTLPEADGQVVLDANGQKAFIDFLGFSTCSGGGANIQPTALLQVTNSTTTSTTTFSGAFAQQSLTISGPATTSASITSNLTLPFASAPLIVIGNETITPTRNPIGLPVYNGTTYASLSGYPGPTGSVIPFISKGSLTNLPVTFLSAWVLGLVGFGAGVYFM